MQASFNSLRPTNRPEIPEIIDGSDVEKFQFAPAYE